MTAVVAIVADVRSRNAENTGKNVELDGQVQCQSQHKGDDCDGNDKSVVYNKLQVPSELKDDDEEKEKDISPAIHVDIEVWVGRLATSVQL